jgi:hypothetical protein
MKLKNNKFQIKKKALKIFQGKSEKSLRHSHFMCPVFPHL